jgi:hypothetical protein
VIFPADYADTYTEVRNCRMSVEHGPVNIRVLAAPDALATYMTRTGTFADGAILLKEERDEGDSTCSGPIKAWTVMEKLPDGTAPATLDWHWQKIDAKRGVMTDNDPGCISCHTDCGPPDGYLHTCTMP